MLLFGSAWGGEVCATGREADGNSLSCVAAFKRQCRVPCSLWTHGVGDLAIKPFQHTFADALSCLWKHISATSVLRMCLSAT